MQHSIDPTLIDVFWLVMGLSMGSFINVLADRLAHDTLPLGRSTCDYCGKVLRATHLIPVFSWLWQRGRSACCKKKLSMQYPLVEGFTGLVCVLVGRFIMGMSLFQSVFIVMLVLALVTILVADVRYHIIPDSMTVLSTVSALALHGLQNLDGLVLVPMLYAVYLLTRKQGIGLGDVKFMIPFGLLLGLQDGLLALYIAVVLGGLWGIVLIATGKKGMKSTIAFGPFLIAGLVIMYVWGEQVWKLVRMV